MKSRKTVFLPIETMSREYKYKIVLAAKLSQYGFRVVVGHSTHLDKIKHYFPSGAYIGKNLFKTLFPTDLSVFESYKKNGWSLIHLDEEGAIFAGEKYEWEQELNGRLDPKILSDDDKVLCWGNFQAEYYKKMADGFSSVKIISSGQPKFCYNDLAYREVLDSDIEFEGKFILFNMNYSVFNDQLGVSSFLETSDSYRTDDIENYEYKRLIWLDQLNNFGRILSIIKKMLQDESFDEFKFVVRPHPAENDSIYKIFFENDDRVIVTNSNTAVEWSRKAFCTIHDGCTTGVEAYLAGCKVVNYRERFNNESVINVIPNSVGEIASSYSELKRKIFCEIKDYKIRNEYLCHEMISNFNADINSFKEVIDETVLTLRNKKTGGVSNILSWHDVYHEIMSIFKNYIRYFFPGKQRLYIKDRKKFPGFSSSDVYAKISRINNVDGYSVSVKKCKKDYFILESVDKG
ncbi:TPA: surface carbohydrate biosynthesis protein [Vibrio vulnificus]